MTDASHPAQFSEPGWAADGKKIGEMSLRETAARNP
jgi:hypothetical protein